MLTMTAFNWIREGLFWLDIRTRDNVFLVAVCMAERDELKGVRRKNEKKEKTPRVKCKRKR